MIAPALEWTALTPPADTYDEAALSRIARYVEAANRATQHFWGDERHDMTVDELVASVRNDEDELVLRWVVSVDGQDVGRAYVSMSREEGARVAYLAAVVMPEARGRGIG
ncbi:MAG TPA: GNAT family N-acetyltransferase, partial [Agrococcus sp.]|nr:GNAT family N-acetyltransferase [Agrococcus sp.]